MLLTGGEGKRMMRETQQHLKRLTVLFVTALRHLAQRGDTTYKKVCTVYVATDKVQLICS